jgi:hypothetical protein
MNTFPRTQISRASLDAQWAARDRRWTVHRGQRTKKKPSPNPIMICIDCPIRAKASTPTTPSLCARSRRDPPPPLLPRPSLGDPWRSIETLLCTRRCPSRSDRLRADTLEAWGTAQYYSPARSSRAQSSRSTRHRQRWCYQCGGSSCPAAAQTLRTPAEMLPSHPS